MKQKRAPLFERLKTGLEDLREYARGERELVETTLSLPDPPRSYAAKDIISVRNKLGLSQSSMALLMHVSAKTIQSLGTGFAGALWCCISDASDSRGTRDFCGIHSSKFAKEA